jgi:hypothetical protein
MYEHFFQPPAGTAHHLNAQDYEVCVRQEAGFCRIQWAPSDEPLSFSLPRGGNDDSK